MFNFVRLGFFIVAPLISQSVYASDSLEREVLDVYASDLGVQLKQEEIKAKYNIREIGDFPVDGYRLSAATIQKIDAYARDFSDDISRYLIVQNLEWVNPVGRLTYTSRPILAAFVTSTVPWGSIESSYELRVLADKEIDRYVAATTLRTDPIIEVARESSENYGPRQNGEQELIAMGYQLNGSDFQTGGTTLQDGLGEVTITVIRVDSYHGTDSSPEFPRSYTVVTPIHVSRKVSTGEIKAVDVRGHYQVTPDL